MAIFDRNEHVYELLTERGMKVNHVTVHCWVQRFTPLLADAARPYRHAVGDRRFVDETYVKVASPRRDARAARRCFQRTIGTAKITPVEIVTDQAAVDPGVRSELAPAAWHRTDQYANNRIEADHGR